MKSKKLAIAIIGAGFGGLSAAARLSSLGCNVTVFEKNAAAGGKAMSIQKDGFRFDTGPSLITMPFVLENLFYDCGENFSDYIEFRPLETLCRYIYSDKTVVNAFSDTYKFAQELSEKTSTDKSSVLNYLNYCKRIYDLTADLFLFSSFNLLKNIFSFKSLNTLLHIKQIDAFRTMNQANSDFFRDPKVIQLFNRYATYNGSNPFKAPATLNIIQHVECNLGGFIASEGIYSVVEAVTNLAKRKGVNFFYDSKVEAIFANAGEVSGLKVSGKEMQFDAIISNIDPVFTYEKLLSDLKSRECKRIKKNEPSSSALVFYFGVEGTYPELSIHNILFSADSKKEFESLFDLMAIADDPTVYIYISSKFCKTDAPQGCENWFVMVNAPNTGGKTGGIDLFDLKKKIFKKIRTATGIDITDKIVCEEFLTPNQIEIRTGSRFGSIYGISSNNRNAAFLRQKNRSQDYKNLYFCGGSSHPGGGIPLVVLSGKIAADLLIKDFKVKKIEKN